MKDTTSLAEMERALMLALVGDFPDNGFIRDEKSGGSVTAISLTKCDWLSILKSDTSKELLEKLEKSNNKEELFNKFKSFVLAADFDQLLKVFSTGVAAFQKECPEAYLPSASRAQISNINS